MNNLPYILYEHQRPLFEWLDSFSGFALQGFQEKTHDRGVEFIQAQETNRVRYEVSYSVKWKSKIRFLTNRGS